MMTSPLEITYLHHSGFAARLGDTLLVFDDARGKPGAEDSLASGFVTPALVASCARTLIFVSHAHADHFNPAVFDLKDAGSVFYILSYDIPSGFSGFRLRPGNKTEVGGAQIEAFESTDEGVSFLVGLDGWTLFHAGDLNLWHWRETSTVKEIEQAERDYEAAVAPLYGRGIDVAFFPLDPRMGEQYDAGALHFSMHVKPAVIIPMHFWDRADAAINFARRNATRHVRILALTEPGRCAVLEKDDEGEVVVKE